MGLKVKRSESRPGPRDKSGIRDEKMYDKAIKKQDKHRKLHKVAGKYGGRSEGNHNMNRIIFSFMKIGEFYEISKCACFLKKFFHSIFTFFNLLFTYAPVPDDLLIQIFSVFK